MIHCWCSFGAIWCAASHLRLLRLLHCYFIWRRGCEIISSAPNLATAATVRGASRLTHNVRQSSSRRVGGVKEPCCMDRRRRKKSRDIFSVYIYFLYFLSDSQCYHGRTDTHTAVYRRQSPVMVIIIIIIIIIVHLRNSNFTTRDAALATQ